MEKEKTVAWLHQQIDEASAKIDEFKLQTHLGKAEVKKSFDERIETLERQRNDLRDEVHQLQDASSSAWEDVSEGCKNSWSAFKTSLQEAVEEFKS